MEEFKNFSAYIRQIENEGAHKGGICKVIPPTGWFHREYDFSGELGDLIIKNPIKQCVNGSKGAYNLTLFDKKDIRVRDFQKYCARKENSVNCDDMRDREKKFWRCMSLTAGGNNDPLYGAYILCM